jgi:hypothetical protein
MKRLHTFESFLNESEFAIDWIFSEDDLENDPKKQLCVTEIISFFKTANITFLDAEWDQEYNYELGYDPNNPDDTLGERVYEAFLKAKNYFREVDSFGWKEYNNFQATYTLYEKGDFKIVIEKGDRGWNWAPRGEDKYVRVGISTKDYDIFRSSKVDPFMFFKNPSLARTSDKYGL